MFSFLLYKRKTGYGMFGLNEDIRIRFHSSGVNESRDRELKRESGPRVNNVHHHEYRRDARMRFRNVYSETKYRSLVLQYRCWNRFRGNLIYRDWKLYHNNYLTSYITKLTK